MISRIPCKRTAFRHPVTYVPCTAGKDNSKSSIISASVLQSVLSSVSYCSAHPSNCSAMFPTLRNARHIIYFYPLTWSHVKLIDLMFPLSSEYFHIQEEINFSNNCLMNPFLQLRKTFH